MYRNNREKIFKEKKSLEYRIEQNIRQIKWIIQKYLGNILRINSRLSKTSFKKCSKNNN